MRLLLYMLCITILTVGTAAAQDTLKTETETQKKVKPAGHGPRFVDENGDGFNDNAPDHDGDGIPNGLDPDYQGQKYRHHKGFRDLDGDGVDDNLIVPDENGEQRGIGPADSKEGQQTPSTDGAQEKHQRRKGKNP